MAFAIDTSGSMGENGRMDDLRRALRVLSGQGGAVADGAPGPASAGPASSAAEPSDTSDSGTASTDGFLTLKPREDITLIEFGGGEKSRLTIDIPSDEAGLDDALTRIDEAIDGYTAEGGTEIYGTVAAA